MSSRSSSINQLKRKGPDSDSDTDPDPPSIKVEPKTADEPPTSISAASTSSTTTTTNVSAGHARPDEYEAGRVICEACGMGVSFRDDESGGFTLKQWEAHRTTCPAAPQRPPAPPVSFAGPSNSTSTEQLSTQILSSLHPSSSTASTGGAHAPKRRRAKRTEEERIEYLRADPYVGKFEAYRVLCASCDKWIRLRPNSTYCSIPWDAHRKSCLAKKINTKNPYALSERNSLFAKDPDVRKFDPERLLCNLCDHWLSLPPDDHLGAVQRWISHRASCGRPMSMTGGGSSNLPERRSSVIDVDAAEDDIKPSPHSESPVQRPPPAQTPSSSTQPPSLTTTTAPAAAPQRTSPPSPYLLTPLTYAPAHESRRRNAEQRAATLRADRLIGRVEPNRVFCSLCEKWVQLRQDSSYCAYPWVQHRGKCLRRSERRNAKAAEIASMKAASSSQQHPSNSNPHRRFVHHSQSSHSTHPSHSSSHSSLGRGYSSTHPHHQQQQRAHQGSAHSMPGPHRGAHHGDEDAPMSDGELDYPNASASGSDDDQDDVREDMKQRRVGDGAHDEGAGVESEEDEGPTIHPSNAHKSTHPTTSHRAHASANNGHTKFFSQNDGRQPGRRPDYSRQQMARASGHHLHRRMGHDVSSQAVYHPSSPSRRVVPPMGPTGIARRTSLNGAGEDLDAEGEPDADGDVDAEEAEAKWVQEVENGQAQMNRGIPRRPHPVGLADLDSPAGRKHFVQTSLTHLFSTTYESTDELSISALLTYLNAAMPADKHEDFDTTEVARAVAALAERGRVVFEGDVVRLVE
ncbi:hypothetical protein BDN70DRAFT_936904 [Pholiota conissans]|uniref:MCM3-like winged helix domain-containing protein n=1 Tax=Pholiota conissans TaxID=109636 RepID=A0A9P6CPM8_9AGAR|nr:hypothetical protein BDN70DRAFT_936904 [Pholiota conissans]